MQRRQPGITIGFVRDHTPVIVATFNAIDRVADATGTPIDEERMETTAEMRAQLGIDRFPSATSP